MSRIGYGPSVGKERCIEILTEEIEDYLPQEKWEDYEMAVNRVMYEFQKLWGAKPKYHKGKYINSWYTCGNCGHGIAAEHQYCPNCGYYIQRR